MFIAGFPMRLAGLKQKGAEKISTSDEDATVNPTINSVAYNPQKWLGGCRGELDRAWRYTI